MNTSNQIIDFLQYSTQQYEDNVLQIYFKWCYAHSQCPKHFQQLLANATINKWFLKELSKLENDFVQALPFFMKQKKDLHIEYQVAIGFIYTIWPQPLIQNIAAVIGSLPKETVEGHLRYCYNTQAN